MLSNFNICKQNGFMLEINNEIFEGFYFFCPVCENSLKVRFSKKNKPYCICDDCGVQLFARAKNGIEKFKKKVYYKLIKKNKLYEK